MSSGDQLSFFPADVHAASANGQVRAYIATAMTGLSDDDRRDMHEKAKEGAFRS